MSIFSLQIFISQVIAIPSVSKKDGTTDVRHPIRGRTCPLTITGGVDRKMTIGYPQCCSHFSSKRTIVIALLKWFPSIVDQTRERIDLVFVWIRS
jgi:hypothetical protein